MFDGINEILVTRGDLDNWVDLFHDGGNFIVGLSYLHAIISINWTVTRVVILFMVPISIAFTIIYRCVVLTEVVVITISV